MLAELVRRTRGGWLLLSALALLFTPACEDGGLAARDGSETHFLSCNTNGDCAALSASHVCDEGYCRGPGDPPRGEAAAAGGTPSTASACEQNRVGASELLVLGDSLLELSDMGSYLNQLAREEGALPAGAAYRDSTSSLLSFLAQNSFDLGSQYAQAVLDGTPRIVVMNGGATDMMQSGCSEPPSDDCPRIVDAVAGARSLLARMADDGVQSVVYAFYPDPLGNPPLLARLDRLRPLVAAVCAESRTPCHFLDLRPVFAGHYDDYVAADGQVFSAAGAEATARAIWAMMKARCLAR
jgi:hypothetical protein